MYDQRSDIGLLYNPVLTEIENFALTSTIHYEYTLK